MAKKTDKACYCASPNHVEVSEMDMRNMETLQTQVRNFYNSIADYYIKKIEAIEGREDFKQLEKKWQKTAYFRKYTEKRRFIDSFDNAVKKYINRTAEKQSAGDKALKKEIANTLNETLREKGHGHFIEKILAECKSNRIVEDGKTKKILQYLDISPFDDKGYGAATIAAYFRNKIDKDKLLFNSTTSQKIAQNLFRAVDKYITGEGKKIKRKSKQDYLSVTSTFSCGYIIGMELSEEKDTLTLKLNRNTQATFKLKWRGTEYDAHVMKALDGISSGACKSITIKPEKIRGRLKYRVIFTLEGTPYGKCRKLGKGTVGVDPGVSTINAESDNGVLMLRCNEKENETLRKMENEQKRLQRLMDRSRRATNPDNYNGDGTVKQKKERKRWKYSKNYRTYRDKAEEISRKIKAKREIFQYEGVNLITGLGDVFIMEKTNNDGLMRRKKETTVNERTGRINPKKRFGKTISYNAPSAFKEKLRNKVTQLGGTFVEADNRFACSQYDFTDRTFTQHALGERAVTNSRGDTMPRDAVAAFNIRHLDLHGIDEAKRKNETLDKKIRELKDDKTLDGKEREEKVKKLESRKTDMKKSPEWFRNGDMEKDYPKFLKNVEKEAERLRKEGKTSKNMGIEEYYIKKAE